MSQVILFREWTVLITSVVGSTIVFITSFILIRIRQCLSFLFLCQQASSQDVTYSNVYLGITTFKLQVLLEAAGQWQLVDGWKYGAITRGS